MMRLFITLIFFLFAVSVKAQNLAQMTGGNYIYAQNGQLTFNLEPGLFENRTWAFDNKKDSARTEFTTNLPLKTKHASQFHGYEIAALEAMNMRVVVTGGSNFAMLMRPVYSYNKQGRYVKAWLPTAAGWLVRVGGIIARNVLPPIVMRCLTNTKCKVLLSVLAAHACVVNFMWGKEGFLREIGLPEGICEQAKEAGFKKDPETGQYTKNQPYKVTVIWDKKRKGTPHYKEEVFGAQSEEQAKNMLRAKCNAMIGQHFEGKDPNDWSNYGLEGTIVKVYYDEKQLSCRAVANDGEDFTGPAWDAQIEKKGYAETLTIVDIANFASKDFAKNPNPYINDKGQVGEELRGKIIPYAYVHKGGSENSGNSASTGKGSVTAASNVYIDPKTGNAVQDVVTVSTVNKPSNPDLPSTGSLGGGSDSSGGDGNSPGLGGSGGTSLGGSGNSGSAGSTNDAAAMGGTTNNVTVTTNPRPDRQHDAVAAESNSPNGTGSGSGAGSGSGNGDASGAGAGGDASGAGGGFDCEKNKNTVACAEMGEMDEQFFDDIEVPQVSNDTQWSADSFLPANGSCPAPKTFNVWGRPFQVSYEPLCELVRKIRFIVLIAFLIMSAKIVFGGLKGS